MKIIKTVILVVSIATMAFVSSRAEEANAGRRSARASALKMTTEERERANEELASFLRRRAEDDEENFIKTELRKRLKDSNLSSSTQLKEWSVNAGTSNVCVTVCTDSISWGDETVLAFRELRFSDDGRLLSISPIKEIRRNGRNPHINRK